MIRTEVVKLTVIPAVAYRQKLPSGDTGVTVLREGAKQPGLATISKSTGEAVPAKNSPKRLYPLAAYNEAISLTAGMPYKKHGSVSSSELAALKEVPEAKEEPTEDDTVIDSSEYQMIVDAYTDKNGKLSYDLLNKDLIRFAHSSKTVRTMQEEGASVEKVRSYIITTKFSNITGNHDLTRAQAKKMAVLLDAVYPKQVFKELNNELRKKAAGNKRK